MIDTPEIVQTVAQQTAVIRLTISQEEVPEAMGPAIREVIGAMRGQRVVPVGPIFMHYFRMAPEVLDFEIGAPVATPIAATGRVKPGVLPAARVARTVYHGPYEDIGVAWDELGSWIERAGQTPASDVWAVFVKGPESGLDASAWRTELNRPLA